MVYYLHVLLALCALTVVYGQQDVPCMTSETDCASAGVKLMQNDTYYCCDAGYDMNINSTECYCSFNYVSFEGVKSCDTGAACGNESTINPLTSGNNTECCPSGLSLHAIVSVVDGTRHDNCVCMSDSLANAILNEHNVEWDIVQSIERLNDLVYWAGHMFHRFKWLFHHYLLK